MSRPVARSLSSTSYAILGLLAIRSWTPYELTRQMTRSFSRFWPRAESKLYEEPKKLVEHGFASASADSVDRRPRTRYHITAAGRRALQRWLTERPQMPVLEAEPLLRIFLVEHGRRTDIAKVLQEVGSWAASMVVADAEIAQAYLDGAGHFPRRIAQITVVGRFLSDFALMTYRWSRWALEVVEGWPEDLTDAVVDRQTLIELASRRTLVDEPGGEGPPA